METVGLFRRTAAKSSIESLKEEIELNQGCLEKIYNDFSVCLFITRTRVPL